MDKKLIYIYNPFQAEFIIKEVNGQYLHKIGKGNKGDVLITFYNVEQVREALRKWNKQ